MSNARIDECGNGFPTAGDLVPGSDGELYRIVSTDGSIHTSRPGVSNHIFADVELASWDDVESDDDTHPSQCVIQAP